LAKPAISEAAVIQAIVDSGTPFAARSCGTVIRVTAPPRPTGILPNPISQTGGLDRSAANPNLLANGKS
jgi:hypothetical protein